MTDVLVKPAFVSTSPDTGEATKFGPNAWNASRLFSGGNAGDLIVRDAASTTGASWVPTAPTAVPSLQALMAMLAFGESTALQVIGDSTGDGPEEWVYLTAQWLATRFPAFTVNYRHWNGTTYDVPTVIQSGAGGARAASFLSTAAVMRLPAEEVGTLTTDLDLRAKILPTSWRLANGFNHTVVARLPDAGVYYSFWFAITQAGTLIYRFSANGTTLSSALQSTVAVADTGATPQWVRVTHEPGATRLRFYTSPDGVTWTQLGADVTISAGSPYWGTNGTLDRDIDDYTLGACGSGTNPFSGVIYGVEIRNGVGGPPLAPLDLDSWAPSYGPSSFTGAPVLEVLNGSQSGANVSYFTDPAKWPGVLLNYSQVLAFVSLGHNEVDYLGAAEMAHFNALYTIVKAALPHVALCVLTQNPQIAPALHPREHGLRQQRLQAYCRRTGIDVIDIFRVFQADPRGLAALINAGDGVHPNTTAGDQLWAAIIQAALGRS